MKTFTLQQIRDTATKRPSGYVEDVLSVGTVEGDKVTLTDESYNLLIAKYRPGPQSVAVDLPYGPGTELKALLAKIGIESTPTCSCNAMAKKMNKMGVEWCKSADGLAEILAVMKREHGRRKSILPWSDTAAAMLVRLACRRARAA
jgi:hypothetical protein